MDKVSKELYAEKLLDPRWQRKRLLIFERDGWYCHNCGTRDITLAVHHREYCNCNPWEAPDDSLITLCKDCHQKETEQRKSCEDHLLGILRKQCCIDQLERFSELVEAHIDRGYFYEWLDNCWWLASLSESGKSLSSAIKDLITLYENEGKVAQEQLAEAHNKLFNIGGDNGSTSKTNS